MFGTTAYCAMLAVALVYASDNLIDYLYRFMANMYDTVIYICAYIQVKSSQFSLGGNTNDTQLNVDPTAAQPAHVTVISCTHIDHESHTIQRGHTCSEDGVVVIEYEQGRNLYMIMRNSFAYEPDKIDSLIASIDINCNTVTRVNTLYSVVLVTAVEGKADLIELFVKLAGPYRDFRDNLDVTLESILMSLDINYSDDKNEGTWYFYGPHGCAYVPVSDSDLFTVQYVLSMTGFNKDVQDVQDVMNRKHACLDE
jgi:hypothetical protein